MCRCSRDRSWGSAWRPPQPITTSPGPRFSQDSATACGAPRIQPADIAGARPDHVRRPEQAVEQQPALPRRFVQRLGYLRADVQVDGHHHAALAEPAGGPEDARPDRCRPVQGGPDVQHAGRARNQGEFVRIPVRDGGSLDVQAAARVQRRAGRHERDRGGLVGFRRGADVDTVALGMMPQHPAEAVTREPGHERRRIAQPGRADRDVEGAPAGQRPQHRVVGRRNQVDKHAAEHCDHRCSDAVGPPGRGRGGPGRPRSCQPIDDIPGA